MNGVQRFSLLLVNDDPRFRAGLRTLINFLSNEILKFDIVGETPSVEQAVKLAVEQHPTLILLDLELASGQSGLNVLLKLKEIYYTGKVLVMSDSKDDDLVFNAMQAGACGYLWKDKIITQLHEAIETVIKGEIYLPPEIATCFFRLFHFYSGRSLKASQTVHLTEREQEVLHWLVEGASNEEIAQRLYIRVATVKAHLTAIFEKLGVSSRSQAIVKALKIGLVCA